MIRHLLFIFVCIGSLRANAAIGVDAAIVPEYLLSAEKETTDKWPIYFWAELSGLTPERTYSYATALQIWHAPPDVITSQPSFPVSNQFTADEFGKYKGWFRAVNTWGSPGAVVQIQLILKNNFGTPAAINRIALTTYPIKTLAFGFGINDSSQGSVVYDRFPESISSDNLVIVYDDIAGFTRPIAISHAGEEAKNRSWKIIFPNTNRSGIRRIEYRDAKTGSLQKRFTDADGIWCSGVNTTALSSGDTGVFLYEAFVLLVGISIPDTVHVDQSAVFAVTTADDSVTYNWDFGDKSNPATQATVSHSYPVAGVYLLKFIADNGHCKDVITKNVVVLKNYATAAQQPGFYFTAIPNPTSGHVQLNTRTTGNKIITVVNMLGELISQQSVSGNLSELDLSGQQQGIYLVRVFDTATGKTGVRRIVLAY